MVHAAEGDFMRLLGQFEKTARAAEANRLFALLHEEEFTDSLIRFDGSVHADSLRSQVWYWSAEYLYSRHADIAREVNYILAESQEDTMTQEQFNGMMQVYLDGLKKQPAQPYAADALAWAAKNGIMVGDGNGNQQPMMFMAREDAVLIEQRAMKKMADAIREAFKKLGV